MFACAQVINGAREMGIRVRASLIVTCTDQTVHIVIDLDEESRNSYLSPNRGEIEIYLDARAPNAANG